MPDSMKAVAFTAPQQAELVDWPCDPSPVHVGQVAGPTLVTLVSPGTEVNAYLADRTEPGLSGYAAVFRAEQVARDVTDVAPGDVLFCMGNHVSWQRTDRAACLKVPPGLAPEVAVAARLMNVTWSTLTTTTARPPDRVLITGLGPVGHLAAQVFQAAGYRVTAVDPSEPRRAMAMRMGIADVRSAAPLDDPAICGQIGLALECAGHEQAVLECCKMVRKRGEVVLIGVPWKQRTDLTAHTVLHAIFHQYAVVRSGWEWEVPHHPRDFTVGSLFGQMAGAMEWLQAGRVQVDGLFRLMPPARVQEAWQDLLNMRTEHLSLVFDWPT